MSPQDANLPATTPQANVEAYRQSTNAAHLCGEIVKATAQVIQGKRYVKVEGWQAIAIAHGCTASSRDVEVIEGGIRAMGEIRRMSDGFVIATAEGFVGDDEKMWASRPMFARRAMAQTRAISRACRSAFAHVVVMIDKSLSTTPAEEMQGISGQVEDWADEAMKDGLATTTTSNYKVQKRNKAVAAGWKVTVVKPSAIPEQILDYIDMAENVDEIVKILNVNTAHIEGSLRMDEINAAATKLIEWFEKQAAPALQ